MIPAVSPGFSTTKGEPVENLSISLLGYSPQHKGPNPIMIGGFLHSIEFDSSQANVTINRGDTSYNWYYDSGWQGDTSFMDVSASSSSSGLFKLVAGIEADENPGWWNLSVNGNEYDVWVKKPQRSLSLTTADFRINFEPFTSETKSSSPQKFILTNEGNCVLEYKTKFEQYGSRITASDPNGMLYPDEKVESTITFTSGKWKPGYREFSGTIDITPINVVSNATFALISKYQASFNMNISVGHSGYEIKELSEGITVQYLDKTKMKYGSTKTLSFYLTGDKPVNIDVSAEEVKLKSVKGAGKTGVPTTVSLEPGREYRFNVTVKSNVKNTTAHVIYRIKQGETQREYTTSIRIDEKRPSTEKEEEPFTPNRKINMMILLIGVVLVVLYFILTRFRNEEVEDEEKEER